MPSNDRYRDIIRAAAALLLCGLLLPQGTGAAGDRITVVLSSADEPFKQAAAGFQGQLARQGVSQMGLATPKRGKKGLGWLRPGSDEQEVKIRDMPAPQLPEK